MCGVCAEQRRPAGRTAACTQWHTVTHGRHTRSQREAQTSVARRRVRMCVRACARARKCVQGSGWESTRAAKPIEGRVARERKCRARALRAFSTAAPSLEAICGELFSFLSPFPSLMVGFMVVNRVQESDLRRKRGKHKRHEPSTFLLSLPRKLYPLISQAMNASQTFKMSCDQRSLALRSFLTLRGRGPYPAISTSSCPPPSTRGAWWTS